METVALVSDSFTLLPLALAEAVTGRPASEM